MSPPIATDTLLSATDDGGGRGGCGGGGGCEDEAEDAARPGGERRVVSLGGPQEEEKDGVEALAALTAVAPTPTPTPGALPEYSTLPPKLVTLVVPAALVEVVTLFATAAPSAADSMSSTMSPPPSLPLTGDSDAAPPLLPILEDDDISVVGVVFDGGSGSGYDGMPPPPSS